MVTLYWFFNGFYAGFTGRSTFRQALGTNLFTSLLVAPLFLALEGGIMMLAWGYFQPVIWSSVVGEAVIPVKHDGILWPLLYLGLFGSLAYVSFKRRANAELPKW